MGFKLAGRYRLERSLGSGGMAEVWQARDEVLARQVAVKLVNAQLLGGPAAWRRFREEARAGARLAHPHIVTVHDYGEAKDAAGAPMPYLVMELLTGQTLAQRIGQDGLPVAEAVRVCGQLAEALAVAHRAGIVHRDVKPANVFLTSTGVKVLDFGIATVLRDAEGTHPDPATPVSTEPLLGTVAYLAPEVGGGVTTPAVDVYALGVVLTEVLTGRHVLDAPLPARVPVEVAVLCSRCRATDPAVRPPAEEVARTLLGLAGRLPSAGTSRAAGRPGQDPAGAVSGSAAGDDLGGDPCEGSRGLDAADLGGSGVPGLAEHGAGVAAAGSTPAPPPERAARSDPPTRVLGPGDRPYEPDAEPREYPPGPGDPFAPPGPPADGPGDGADGRGVDGPGADGHGEIGPGGDVPADPLAIPVAPGGTRARRIQVAVAVGVLVAAVAAVVAVGVLRGVGRVPEGGAAPSAPPTAPAPVPPGIAPSSAPSSSPAAPPVAADTDTALTRMRPVVRRGLAAGDIRSDVATDLENVIRNLQDDLAGGEPVNVERRVAELRQKIATRLREGGLSQARADELTAILAAA